MAVASKDEYVKMDEKYDGETYKMSANTLLTWPGDIDGSRLYMSTSETKQCLAIINPDVPRLSTGWENPLGRLNEGEAYKKLYGKWEVRDVIKKFKNGEIYTLVLYNQEKKMWDMIEKPVAESLGEKYGFFYNTEKMDSLQVGDVVEDEVIYKSTGYDDHMNYRYGKNAKVYYSTSTDTLEDAIKIRKGWADGIRSVEVDDVFVPVNNNHIPLNLYGKEKGEYKCCPDFGEPIKDSCVIAFRPIKNDHVLIDFQNDALKQINYSTDSDYYISECINATIYDINIYYNGGENPFPNNSFYRQLHGYYEEICEYVEKMNSWASFIKNSGDKYTDNIPFYKSIYQHYNDPEWLFCGKEKNKPFGYMTIVFSVKEILGLVPGSKASGRFGCKGVISKVANTENTPNPMLTQTIDSILDMLDRPISDEEREKIAAKIEIIPDDEMPYTDKFPIDIILNASGAIRRLNPGQIDEVDLNFQSECVREEVCKLPTLEEKADLIFEYLGMVNDAECKFFYEMYQGFDEEIQFDDHMSVIIENRKEKERFVKNIEKHGFYIRKELDRPLRYEAIKAIYERFDFIKPLPLYIDIFGTKRRRIIKDGIVGDKYMMFLKHNSNKNFSARSTFRVNRAGLPVKDTTKRDNRSQYSRSPVRIGEAYNLMDSIPGRLLAEYDIFMRSSTLGKKSLQRILEAEGNPLEIKRLELKTNYLNANAIIFENKLKAMGIGIEYVKEGIHEDMTLEDVVMPLQIGKYTIYDTPLKRQMYNKIFAEFIHLMETYSVTESYIGEKEDIIWKMVFELDDIKALDIDENTKNMLIGSSKGELKVEEEKKEETKEDVVEE